MEQRDGLFCYTCRLVDVWMYICMHVQTSLSLSHQRGLPSQSSKSWSTSSEAPPLPLILQMTPDIPLDRPSHEDGDVSPLRVRSLASVEAGKGSLSDRGGNDGF